MKELLERIKKENIFLEENNGKLQIHSESNHIPSDIIEDIRTYKQKLIEFIKIQSDDYKRISPVEKMEDYPLSHAQKRLWTLSQFEQASVAYNMPSYFYLHKDFEIDSFQKAFTFLIKRHQSLRTVFKVNNEGHIRQRIISEDQVDSTIKLIQGSRNEKAGNFLKSFMAQDVVKSFNLEEGPLFRAYLIQLNSDETVFYINLHHIICDGWSHNILERELMTCYDAYLKGERPLLTSLEIQYVDYVIWKKEQCEKKINFINDENFWLEQFKNEEFPLIKLPGSKIRPRLKTYNGLRLATSVSKNLTANFKELCESQNASLFMGLVTVWNVLFYKYTSSNSFVIGTPVAGRDHMDLRDQVGFYVNTLALMNVVDPNMSFNDFFKNVKENTLKAYEHQSYPFDQLVEKLDIKRDMSRNPLFDIMIKLLNTGEVNKKGNKPKKISENIQNLGAVPARFDLNISFEEVGDILVFDISYNIDIYEKYFVEKMILHFKQILSEIVRNPSEKIALIDYNLPPEGKDLIYNFNKTEHSYSENQTLSGIIEERARLTPNNTYIVDSVETKTFKEVNDRANQIARVLKRYGVKKGGYIAVHMGRSADLIISLYGILKTGAAYVPLEPSLPAERKTQISRDLKIKFIITDKENLTSTLEYSSFIEGDVDIICVDGENEEKYISKNRNNIVFSNQILSESTLNFNSDISSQDEAYVIFTSGSTGKPKGVVVQHKPVLNLIEWVNSTFNVTHTDKILCVASISFDLSVYDIFGIAKAGGVIRMTHHRDLQNPKRLVEIIYNESITFWNSAPATMMMVMDELLSKKTSEGSLRLTFLSGDWVPVTISRDLKQYFKDIEVVALGGATEAVIWSNYYNIRKIKKNWTSVPYGKPIWNAKYYILDSFLKPCAIGVEGDLYIGGEVLAKEYKNDFELTKEKFIQNPFSSGLIYKTGDRARYFPDGNIEFLGRVDSQVKIRGFRIELDEIRYTIEQYAGIKNGFVTTIGEKNNKQIVAYFTTSNKIDKLELKNFLQLKLPVYMMPQFLIKLDKFSTTKNGKLDRSALPNPLKSNLVEDIVFPETATELRVRELWAEVLKISVAEIGIINNFFEIGGDSLKAMMLISKIKKEVGVAIDYEKIFYSPTIRDLANYIDSFKLVEKQSNRSVEGDDELVF